MNQSARSFGVAAMVMLGFASPALADTLEILKNQWEVGPQAYYFEYQEPDPSVKFAGMMFGVGASYTHHEDNHLMVRVDTRGAWGQVDYSSPGSGSLQDIDDWTLEGRLTAGYDLTVSDNKLFTPFVGVGYRYLNDDSSGRLSSSGDSGYERESNYFYSPIGVEYTMALNGGWKLGATLEYDIFWLGEQRSHLEDAIAGLNTLDNKQKHGYGARAGVNFRKSVQQLDVVFGPFVRWWSIDNSEMSDVTYGGAIVGYGYEPKNQTLEVGGDLTVRF